MAQLLRTREIVQAAVQLQHRVSERFPGSGLSEASAELVRAARETAVRVRRRRAPQLLFRLLVLAVIVAFVYGMYVIGRDLDVEDWFSVVSGRTDESPQALDAIVNLFILAAGAIWFLLTLEGRLTRHVALKHLNELRSIVHLVDMSQLFMDPSAVPDRVPPVPAFGTPATGAGDMAAFLNDCTDMLALTGKLSALYGERSGDPSTNMAANDIEMLASSLTVKLWQKASILALSRRSPHSGSAKAVT